jgi:aquaporin NIP
MRKYAAEMFGTFALVFAGTGAVVIDSVTGGGVGHVGVAVTFGLIVMAMIYAVGDVSGAHLNPAVTVGFWLAGRLRGRWVGPYILSQLTGAIIASLLLRAMFSNAAHLGATLPAGSALQSFALEAVLTGMLMFVILCVSTGPKEIGIVAGIAIGAVIGLEAMFAGPISGASMNPARSLAPALVSGDLHSVWIYVAGPLAGAVGAIPCWQLTRGYVNEVQPATPVADTEEVQHVEQH